MSRIEAAVRAFEQAGLRVAAHEKRAARITVTLDDGRRLRVNTGDRLAVIKAISYAKRAGAAS